MEGELEDRNDPPDAESKDEDDQSTTVNSENLEERTASSTILPQFETLDGSYHFTLTGYSLAKGIGSGQYFSSGTFAVGGHDWAIYFYPDGKNPEDGSEFVSVFVALASDSFDVQALFEIILLDQSGNGKHKIHSHFNGEIESPYILERQGSMWGYTRFIRRDELEMSDFLKEDTVEFTGRVGVLLSSMKSTKLITTTLLQQDSPEDNTPHPQSTDDNESSPQDIGSQSGDAIVSKVKGRRLEEQLAKYHLKLMSTQSPFNLSAKFGTREGPTN